MSNEQLDRLTSQLYELPAIVGRMGLSIAAAQKEMNLDYVNGVLRLMEMIAKTQGGATANAETLTQLLTAIAPTRYQFTETTIEFSADLSESKDVNVQGGLSLGTKAVTINAAAALAYGYDYQAAARVTCVIHAQPVGAPLAKDLVARAQDIQGDKLSLPAPNQVEAQLQTAVQKIYDSLTKPKDN